MGTPTNSEINNINKNKLLLNTRLIREQCMRRRNKTNTYTKRLKDITHNKNIFM